MNPLNQIRKRLQSLKQMKLQRWDLKPEQRAGIKGYYDHVEEQINHKLDELSEEGPQARIPRSRFSTRGRRNK